MGVLYWCLFPYITAYVVKIYKRSFAQTLEVNLVTWFTNFTYIMSVQPPLW